MIPTVLLAGFVIALLVPQRRTWLLGLVASLGIAWALVIGLSVERSVGVFLGAFALGAVNAIVGVAFGAGVRRLVGRGFRAPPNSTA